MQKLITSILIILFIFCGFYALYDIVISKKQNSLINTTFRNNTLQNNDLKEVKENRQENIKAVDSLPYDYKLINEKAIFLPTWNNIFNIATMPKPLLKELMETYNYEHNSHNDSWKKTDSESEATFYINRDKLGSLIIQWKNIELSTLALEEKFKEFLIEESEFMKTYEFVKVNKIGKIRMSIAKTKTFNFIAFDIYNN